MDRLTDRLVANIAKTTGAKKIAGKKQHQYTASFKASAINEYENGVSQEEVAKKVRVTQSQVSTWIKNKENIMQDAASAHRKLFRKGRRATKYINLYEKFFKEFLKARSKGHVMNFAWLMD